MLCMKAHNGVNMYIKSMITYSTYKYRADIKLYTVQKLS